MANSTDQHVWRDDKRVCLCGYAASDAKGAVRACPYCDRVWPENLSDRGRIFVLHWKPNPAASELPCKTAAASHVYSHTTDPAEVSCKHCRVKLANFVPQQQPQSAAPSAVDHPSHYGGRDNTYEAIKVIDAWKLDFALGNAVKYIARAGKKDPTKELEDLRKARWYLDHRISQLEKEQS